MENYTRYSFIRHIQHRLMNGCKQNVIRQRDLQFDAAGIVVLNHLHLIYQFDLQTESKESGLSARLKTGQVTTGRKVREAVGFLRRK